MNFQVCQNPLKPHKPTCYVKRCSSDILLTHRPKIFSLPPHSPCTMLAKHEVTIVPKEWSTLIRGSTLHRGRGKERMLGLCVKVFSPCFLEKTTQENLFTKHRSACKIWVDSGIHENWTLNSQFRAQQKRRLRFTCPEFILTCQDFFILRVSGSTLPAWWEKLPGWSACPTQELTYHRQADMGFVVPCNYATVASSHSIIRVKICVGIWTTGYCLLNL